MRTAAEATPTVKASLPPPPESIKSGPSTEPTPGGREASSQPPAPAQPPSPQPGMGQPDTESHASAATRLKQVTERLVTAFMDKIPIEGKVIGWNKGGFHISLDGVAGFCPRSLMELGNPRKPAAYLDQTFRFLITNVDEEIAADRGVAQGDPRGGARSRREEVRKKLTVGAVMRGRVDPLVTSARSSISTAESRDWSTSRRSAASASSIPRRLCATARKSTSR